MNLDLHIKIVGSLTRNDTVVSSSILEDINDISAKCSTTYLSTIISGLPVTGGKLSSLNIIKFDSLETYNLCTEADPLLIGLSDIVLIDESQINAENKTIISVADPVNDSDASNKRYADSRFKKLSVDEAVSSFYLSINLEGLNGVDVSSLISAVYSLISILGYK